MPPMPKRSLADFEDMLAFDGKTDSKGSHEQNILPNDTKNIMVELDLEQILPFPEHKFKLYDGQRLEDMVESIRNHGILLPIIVWHTEDKYVILSGHNRKNAAILAGLTKAFVIIKENITYDEAVLIITETNLRQRSFSDLKHSERAYCLAQHFEALKSQGKRNDLLNEIENLLKPSETNDSGTSSQVGTKLRTDEKLGKDYGLSRNQVARYIRISKLIDDLIEKVDTGDIAFLSAYELSFIENKEIQQQIVKCMEENSYIINMKKAELLRQNHEKGNLNEVSISQILSGEKAKGKKTDKAQSVKIAQAIVSKYFAQNQSKKEITETIEKALELYFSQNQNISEEI